MAKMKNGSNGSMRLGANWLRGRELDVEYLFERAYGSPVGARRSLRQGRIPLRVGDETWELFMTRDDPVRFATSDAWVHQVFLNRNYVIPRGPRGARQEHVLLMLLGAIGAAKHPRAAEEALRFAAERRQEIAATQRSQKA